MSKTFPEFLKTKIEKSSLDAFGREQNKLRSVLVYADHYASIAQVPDSATLIAKLANIPSIKLSPGMVQTLIDLQTEFDAAVLNDKAQLKVVPP